MAVRKPSAFGITVTSLVYFGALFYWKKDQLLGTDPDEMVYAAQMIAVAVAYVAFILWSVQKDLPENIKKMKYIGSTFKFMIWLSIMLVFFFWCLQDDSQVGFLFVGVAILGLGAGFALACLIYTGEESSRLYALKRLVDVYPSITKPDGHVRFNQKLMTTTIVLIIYFMMTNVMIWGLADSTMDIFSSFRSIMAGASGSIMHLGIGPIVTGSIVMQLFAGAKIINLDLQDSDDKQMYQGVQKILVLLMIPIESIPQVYGFLDPHENVINMFGIGWANSLIVLQLFVGSYLVFLMDELVTKWGIGSGISLFIAAGVAQSTFVGTLSPLPVGAGAYSMQNPPSGVLPMIFYTLRTATNSELVSQNGFEMILLNHANPLIALFSSVVVFLVVAYAESSKLELPLTHGKVRGHRGKYPIRLVYASNIPVILMAALLANLNMFTLLFWSHPVLSTVPLLGANGAWSIAPWLGSYEVGQTVASDGFAWYASMVSSVQSWLIPLLDQRGDGFGHSLWQIMLHVFTYVFVMTLG
ncbi:MAG: hypothetical protein CMO20_01880, partial [Thermoplasmata archaeon]|nr:hypothetical protein [Thermoplasmata archaeon]